MAPECRHIKLSGGRCHAVALRGKDYCYFHSAQRRRAARPQAERWLSEIPLLEDQSAIQLAISEVADSLAGNRIEYKRAGMLLYAFQIASQNLRNADVVACLGVTDTVTSSSGEELAGIAPARESLPSGGNHALLPGGAHAGDDQQDGDGDLEDDEEQEDDHQEEEDDEEDDGQDQEMAERLGIPGYKPL